MGQDWVIAQSDSFSFTYLRHAQKRDGHTYYEFEVQCPSGVSFEIRERFSMIELWVRKLGKELAEYQKIRSKKPIALPQMPSKSMKDSIAEMRGKQSFFEGRGRALAAFASRIESLSSRWRVASKGPPVQSR